MGVGGGSADIPGGCAKGRVSPFLIDLQTLDLCIFVQYLEE